MRVDVFWGVKDLNKEGGTHWDAEFIGKAIMDDKLDVSSPEAQNSILDFCKNLREEPFVK